MATKITTPPSVKDVQFRTEPPKEYEGFLYKFTNLDHPLLKAYLGIHKGDINDGYLNSATSLEFKKLLANPHANIKLEYLEFGDYKLMTVRENDILSIGRAENPDAWYNKTNGAPRLKVPNFDAVNHLREQIKAGEYPTTKMTREELEELQFLQVRVEGHMDLVHTIADKIDERGGDTSECEPIIIFEGRGPNGEDMGGDGNHTCQGGLESKKMLDMDVIRIPLADNLVYTNTELKTLSHQMNSGEVVQKNRANDDDLKKQLYTIVKDAHGNTSVLDHPNVQAWLVEKMHKTNKKAKGLIKSVKNEFAREEQAIKDKETFRFWSDKDFNAYAARIRASNPNALVIQFNTGWIKYDEIMRDIEMCLKTDDKGLLQKPIQTDGIDEVIFLGRHKKGADTGEKWDRISSNLKSWMYPYITLLGMRMRVETLSTVKINDLGDEPIMKFINNEAA